MHSLESGPERPVGEAEFGQTKLQTQFLNCCYYHDILSKRRFPATSRKSRSLHGHHARWIVGI